MAEARKKDLMYIVKRALRPVYSDRVTFEELEKKGKVIHRGLAQDWEKYMEDDFQKFIKKHDIKPDDKIAITHWVNDEYIVAMSS